MDPLTMGLIGGGASLLGNIFSSTTSASNTQAQIAAQEMMQMQAQGFNADQAQLARDFSAGQAQKQMDFQQMMSNTAYQRSVADMKRAGLNPAAMFTHGTMESTPGGAMGSGSAASSGTPTVPMPQNTSPLAGLGDAVSKGISSANAITDMNNRIQQNKTEEARTAREWIQARKDWNELPESEKRGKEAGDILSISEPTRRAANIAKYTSEGYGASGSPTNSAARIASSVGSAFSQKIVPWFQDAVSQVTGPSGQSMWNKARDSYKRIMLDFPNLRKTTLNPDYGPPN